MTAIVPDELTDQMAKEWARSAVWSGIIAVRPSPTQNKALVKRVTLAIRTEMLSPGDMGWTVQSLARAAIAACNRDDWHRPAADAANPDDGDNNG